MLVFLRALLSIWMVHSMHYLVIRHGLCLITCAIYRAVTFELTQYLSSHSFIMTFRRFIARGGWVSFINTDNDTNFVETITALSDLIAGGGTMRFTATENIKLKSIPHSSPWEGEILRVSTAGKIIFKISFGSKNG